MKTRSKNILTALLCILLPALLLGGTYYYLHKKEVTNPAQPDNEEDDKNSTSTIPNNNNQDWPLALNTHAKSELIKKVQKAINAAIKGHIGPNAPYYNGNYFDTIKVDGYYGNQTAAALAFLLGGDGKTLTKDQWDTFVRNNSNAYEAYMLYTPQIVY